MAAPVAPGRGTVPVRAPGTPARERAYRSAVQQGGAAAPPAPTLPAARAAQAVAPAASGAAPAGRPGWTPEQIAAAEARAAGKASRDPRSPDYWAQADIAAWAAANDTLARDLKRRVGYQEPSPGGTYVDASALPKDLPAMAQAPIQWQPVGPEQTSPSFTTQGVELPAYAPGDLLDPSRRPPAGSMTSQPIQWQAPTPEQMSPSFTTQGAGLPPYSASDLLRRRGVRNSEMYPIL